ncbi:MAG: Crp/Fnr family transcriptional regulator [Vulcanibacillus sp.]
MMDDILKKIDNAKILSLLREEDRKELASKAHKKLYFKGEFICHQDYIWQNMAFVSSGDVKWTLFSPDGKRQIVFGLEEGSVILGHSLFDGKGMPASLEVISDSIVCIWPKEIVMPILLRNENALLEVMRVLVTNMRRVRNVVYGFSFYRVPQRLAKLLLDHYNPDEGEIAARDLTLEIMAAEVGTTRELISRVLHDFAKEEIIDISRKNIVFTNKEKLEEIARGTALPFDLKEI